MLHRIKQILRMAATRHQATILNYHGVLSTAFPFNVPQHLDVDSFSAHLAYIAEHANCVPLRELLAQIQDDRIAPRTVAITFDDGFYNNLSQALPVIERFGVPVTIFIATGYIGKTSLLWPEKLTCMLALTTQSHVSIDNQRYPLATPVDKASTYQGITRRFKSLEQAQIDAAIAGFQSELGVDDDAIAHSPYHDEFKILTWEQLSELANSPWVTIGSHGVNHLRLTRIDENQARQEISQSKEILETRLKAERLFAYPFGIRYFDYNELHVDLVRACGYSAAVTATAGAVSSTTDIYNIPRNNVFSSHALADIRYLVQGGSAFANNPGAWRIAKGIVTGSIKD